LNAPGLTNALQRKPHDNARLLSWEDGRLLFDEKAYDYVLSILSKAQDPSTWRPVAPAPANFEISLITRTFFEREQLIFATFPCSEVILPGSRTELVYVFVRFVKYFFHHLLHLMKTVNRYVLDAESPAEHSFGDKILMYFRAVGLEKYVRVVYEEMPPCAHQLFFGKLEGRNNLVYSVDLRTC
jgi:hypothetical protein